jgi:hypothetical protein
MGPFRHLLILVVVAVVLRWLWTSSLTERASVEAGRTIFPPTRAIRILMIVFGVAFTSFFLWSWFAVRKPDEWWVPYLFLGFLSLDLFIYPPVLSIEVDGIGSRSWLAREPRKIRWEEVASLHYNIGNKQFIVRANDGRKITHGGFNADQRQFVHEIHKRTRLPLKLTRPGTWKSETFDVPYDEEAQAEEEATSETAS